MAPLDAFRGLAALLVVMFHSWVIARPLHDDATNILPFIKVGDKAVPIFCILSGFLIFRSLAKATSLDDIRYYTKRRVLRIFPLYVATIIVCFFIGSTKICRMPGELFMLNALRFPYFSNPASWSLFVEVGFYAILPIFLISAGPRILAYSSCALGILVWSDMEGPSYLSLWKYFVIGIIGSVLFDRYRERISERRALALFLIGTLLLVVDFRGIDWLGDCLRWMSQNSFKPNYSVSSYTVGLGASFALIMIGTLSSRFLTRIFAATPLRILGVISYSIFLWHDFIIIADLPLLFDGSGGFYFTANVSMQDLPPAPAWVTLAIIIPAVIFWSTISFLLIERPFLLRRPGSGFKNQSLL
jgi:peptidoglycan/LPS O-acetylase OafA/YrhL